MQPKHYLKFFIALNIYIRRQYINVLSFHFKILAQSRANKMQGKQEKDITKNKNQ